VLAINSADDERNPPETGIMERGPTTDIAPAVATGVGSGAQSVCYRCNAFLLDRNSIEVCAR
jgi:hypothetical protein